MGRGEMWRMSRKGRGEEENWGGVEGNGMGWDGMG